MRMLIALAAAAALAVPVSAQQPQQDGVENVELTLNFKEASVDAVLQYVSKMTDWVFVQDSKTSSTIDAVSDAKIPAAKVIEFLNAALRKAGLTITNPYSPALPKRGQILKVMTIEKAKDWSLDIYMGMDDIPVTDQVRTQIIPLKAVNVVEVNKELGELLRKALGSGDMAVSTYSNSLVLSGRSDGINRAARILKVIDVGTSGELKVKVFPLRNADATEAAKTLNDVFKKEAAAGQTGQQNPMGRIWEMFGGGGRGGGERGAGGAGPQPRALAHEMVRITPDTRINALIISATDDNMRIITDLIEKLDDKSAAAIKLQHYPLRFADATTTAKLINDIFADTPTNQQSSRGGGRGGNPMPMWMPGMQQGGSGDTLGATKEVRAVADLRTNSVLVAASEQKLAVINELMERIDRQINDLLVVKIYKLQHADPAQMATVLQSLFRPQVNATQSAGSGRTQQGGGNQGGGGFMGMMMAGGNRGSTQPNPLLPSQEVEITSDLRTNAVIVKASKEFIAIIDDVVKQLDADPTEAMSTYVYRLRNNDATTLAQAIQNLARGSGSGTSVSGLNQQRTGMQGNQLNQQGLNRNGMNSMQNSGGSTRGGGGTGGSSRTRTGGNLGPLDQEEPAGPVQEDDPNQRRGLEGQVDVQPDPSTNSLIIRTSPRNYQAIQNMLQELDKLRPQVLIKVLIADVTLDETMQFGVEGFWENKMRVRGGDLATNRFGTDFALATQGFSYLLTGDEFQASLNVFAREGKLKILATPRILALDNQTASINVGKEVPRISNTTVNQLGNTVNTVQYENIGILLDVTPQINPDGLVTMTVAPEISDLASESESVEISPGVNNPTFNVNRASTTVSVRNGATVVIGGLIRETKDDAVQKVPLLGDIPLVGLLFSSTTQRKVKRELMIFLTPYVAFTAAELEEITQLEKSRLKLLDPRDIDAESDRWLERTR